MTKAATSSQSLPLD